MSSTNTPLTRTAQAAAIFLSTFACGANLALSFGLVPRLLESPTPIMVRQWLRTYSNTKYFFPASTYPVVVAFYFLSWHFRGTGGAKAKLYLAAGLLLSCIGPYTRVVIFPTNRKLIAKVEETKDMTLFEEAVEATVQREESAKWLVDHWGMLNLPRGIAWGLAGLLGLVATV